MNIMNLEKINREVNTLCRKVGAYIEGEQHLIGQKDIDSKGLHDYVTRVDKRSEEKLVDGLSKIPPGSAVSAPPPSTWPGLHVDVSTASGNTVSSPGMWPQEASSCSRPVGNAVIFRVEIPTSREKRSYAEIPGYIASFWKQCSNT